jgi:hypothetical protein
MDDDVDLERKEL